MKTKLPEQLTTVDDIEKFITELNTNGELFHLDDDAHDIISLPTREPLFTFEEAEKINALMEQAFDICDVWLQPWMIKIVDIQCEELQYLAEHGGFNPDTQKFELKKNKDGNI